MAKLDISGRRYGRLVAIRFIEVRDGNAWWECQCDCGNTFVGRVSYLQGGENKSCGCLRAEMRNKAKKVVEKKPRKPVLRWTPTWMIGRTYGRYTVVEHDASRSNRDYWMCRCVCGTEKSVLGGHLRSGRTASCGCLMKEHWASIPKKKDKPEYAIWCAMKSRCMDGAQDSHNYFARGIRVCERWKSSFENFIADMGDRPSERHSIDRINNDGNYEPGNCRWATPSQQSRNNRRNRIVEIDGNRMTLAEAAERFNKDYSYVRQNIIDRKVPVAMVLGIEATARLVQ